MDLKKRSFEKRALGGSLPFKKRCFRAIDEQMVNNKPLPLVAGLSGKAYFGSTTTQDLPIFTNSYVSTGTEKYPHKIRAAGSAFADLHHMSSHASTSSSSVSEDDSYDDDNDHIRSPGPLPGHCHGFVAHTQAFCRRLPCHNGSNYCKRHYEQYVLKNADTHDDDDDVNLTPAPSSTKGRDTEAKVTSSSRSTTSNSQQQDKRFSGAKGECRCKATTTRGRECAYIAVDDTKYCYMHADYDTNPPPRRGGKHSSTSNETPKLKKKEVTSRSSSNVSDSSGKSGGDRKRRNTAEKLAQKHADSPFPLLSMISSDQWANKRVKISSGPFEGHVGHVEKWSNGWVGVRIPDVGLHNRRSFELYLDDNDKTQTEEQKKSIMRSVSRDGDTPSPMFQSQGKRTPSPKGQALNSPLYQPVTPNPTMDEADMRVISSKTRNLDGLHMVDLPEVTPLEARNGRACIKSPVIESLLKAQEHNSKLDMLFGTAALDRGRRSVRRPKIYEDTEMLDKTNKRCRKVSLGMDGTTTA